MPRNQLLRDWIARQYPGESLDIQPASADASFRRYFRLQFADERPSLIVMDAPPGHEDCRPWLKVGALFAAAGVHVPRVLAQDLELGFLMLSDLGNTTYLAVLNQDNAPALYGEALTALVRIQQASQPGVLPAYDRPLLERELDLFPDWYVNKHLGKTLTPAQEKVWQTAKEKLLANVLAQPQGYVHRDYHSRNLMVSDPNPGIIDFQDAVYGPLTYDPVSLFRDAYISWEEEQELDWVIRYWELARRAKLPVPAAFDDFYRDYEWMGAQRQLKVLGIFARLYHRDGKDGYLADMPRVMAYLRRTCERYGELRPLWRLLEELEPSVSQVGYTF
ncbi:aminoglycoside phosphotransferase family protein [Azospira inquinata]|uniref:Phosphotransferase n=1 Tax=Azospira inquinata TaxID=2785627 RepID=A0A975SKX6_9RHOO|nr:phosphotransferase [Azospira inquinata]QWT46438.1 phosphotransferase [Azospira inquinata]QWT48238.1 phosphotransferase [Azospira inquinata]